MESLKGQEDEPTGLKSEMIDFMQESTERNVYVVDPEVFTKENEEKCIYESEDGGSLEVVEYAPAIFRRLRMQVGVEDVNLLEAL